MFAQRIRLLPVIVAVLLTLFVISLFVISGVGRASPSVSDAALSQSPANVSRVHPLTITGITPARDAITAGSKVTIHGTGFAAGARVVFDETPATDVQVVSDTVITATTPANIKSASVDVTVFVGTEGASWSRGSTALVHGYKDDKRP